MSDLHDGVENWVDEARAKLAAGTLQDADFGHLLARLGPRGRVRQRLLYLHANGMHVGSSVVAMDRCEPTRAPQWTQLSATPEFPYGTVRDAILDGWRVVQFPRQALDHEDREIGILGYEFILEKLEIYHD